MGTSEPPFLMIHAGSPMTRSQNRTFRMVWPLLPLWPVPTLQNGKMYKPWSARTLGRSGLTPSSRSPSKWFLRELLTQYGCPMIGPRCPYWIVFDIASSISFSGTRPFSLLIRKFLIPTDRGSFTLVTQTQDSLMGEGVLWIDLFKNNLHSKIKKRFTLPQIHPCNSSTLRPMHNASYWSYIDDHHISITLLIVRNIIVAPTSPPNRKYQGNTPTQGVFLLYLHVIFVSYS